MEKFGIHRAAIFLALMIAVYGRPTSDYGVETEEIIQARLQVESIRDSKPCYATQLEFQTDIKQFDKIMPHRHLRYVPECEQDGVKWRNSQCDHENGGSCFCVRVESGEVVEETRNKDLNKEALDCGRRWVNAEQDCFLMKEKYNHITKEFGLSGQLPLLYYPDCASKGKFKAMQSNEMSIHFCVDTKTGEIIPETISRPGDTPPLTEYICQAYDAVWQEFKVWNESQGEIVVTESSCRDGFLFSECGCPRTCTQKTTFESFDEECICKPACVCPNGEFELDGRCVSLEECNEENPSPKILHFDKLEQLTDGAYSRWETYKENNPNALLESYNALGKEHLSNYGPGGVASDSTNSRMFFAEGRVPTEKPADKETQQQKRNQVENQQTQQDENGEESPSSNEQRQESGPNTGYRGGEPVPGLDKPFLLTALKENGPRTDEVQRVQETGTVIPYGTGEGESDQGENPDNVEEDSEDFEGIKSNEREEEENFSENEGEFEKMLPEAEEVNETMQQWLFEGKEEELPENENEEEGVNPFSQEEEEREIEESSSEDEKFIGRKAYPEEEESTTDSGKHTYHEEAQTTMYIEETTPPPPEEVENIRPELEEENSFPREEGYSNPEAGSENHEENESSPEQEEPENELDERLLEEPSHLPAFSSLPLPEHDEAYGHQVTVPCEETNASDSPTSPPEDQEQFESEEEEELAEIDRVLIENNIIQSKPIEATFQKHSPSVKKNAI